MALHGFAQGMETALRQAGGSALTWAGEPLTWPARGRVERAVFLGGGVPDDLVFCLTGKR